MSVTTEKPEIPVPAQREPASLFRYSTWLHLGAGAEQCEEVNEAEGTNNCGDRGHWHAWCRLPNPLQQAEIRERALAAKARKIRQLRDPQTDGYAILDEEFAARAREGDRAREPVIDELIGLDYFTDYYAAMMEVRQLEDPNSDEADAKLYAHIEDDQARLVRLEAMSEQQRPADEYDELKRHVGSYQEAVDRVVKERTEPARKALEQLPTGQLLDQLRDKRIDAESRQEFQRVFEIHEWLSCAYRQPDGDPVFADLVALERAAPEIHAGLSSTFVDLKRTAQEAQGN